MTEPTWRLQLLGRIELAGPDAAAAERVLVQPKHLALLAFLAMESRGDGVHYRRRDELATLLWPELNQERARASLRRVVHQTRAALGADVLISRGDEEIALDHHVMTSDVLEFARAIAQGQLAAAMELWKGDLMPGFHLADCGELEQRIEEQRVALREEAGGAVWALAQRLEADDQLSLAAQWARRAPKFARDNERVLRRTMTMLERLGDRAGALQVYDEFARRLRDEFDAQPSPETAALVTKIRGS